MTSDNPTRTIDRRAFTGAVTVASRALILRDRLLRRVKRLPPAGKLGPGISRQVIASGQQKIDTVYVEPPNTPARAAVLICHGIGETVDHWQGAQSLLASCAVASLVFDYAGFGRSTGIADWRQCEGDAVAAFGLLKDLAPGLPVSLLGFSLGSGVAGAILNRVAPECLILCSSFTSFGAAAHTLGVPRILSFMTPSIWNTVDSVRECALPVLILHCEQDRLFPVQMAADLASSCGARARLVLVPEHQHNEPFYRPQPRYWNHVVEMALAGCEQRTG